MPGNVSGMERQLILRRTWNILKRQDRMIKGMGSRSWITSRAERVLVGSLLCYVGRLDTRIASNGWCYISTQNIKGISGSVRVREGAIGSTGS